MANKTALPLPAIVEIATSLIESGACIAVPAMTLSTKFACQDGAVRRMTSLALTFAQRFGPIVPIFIAVSALTASCGSGGGFGDMNSVANGVEQENRMSNITTNGGVGSNDLFGQFSSAITLGELMDYCTQAACKEYDSSSVVDGGAGGGGSSVSNDDEGSDNGDGGVDEHHHHHYCDSASKKIPVIFQILTDKISETLRCSTRIPPGFKLEPEYCLLPQTQFQYKGNYSDPLSVTNHNVMPINMTGVGAGGYNAGMMGGGRIDAIGDALIAMAVWLRAHSVIVEVKEYLTPMGRPLPETTTNNSSISACHSATLKAEISDGNHARISETPSVSSAMSNATTTTGIIGGSKDDEGGSGGRQTSNNYTVPARQPIRDGDFETLYNELVSKGYLSGGDISTTALVWRLGRRLEGRKIEKFREWGVREKRLMAITRIPTEGDDWGAP